MSTSISLASILILLLLFIFFITEAATVIRIRNKKVKGKIRVHLLGTLTTALLTVCVALSTFGVNYDSNLFVTITVVLSVLFYIVLGWQTLFKIKR